MHAKKSNERNVASNKFSIPVLSAPLCPSSSPVQPYANQLSEDRLRSSASHNLLFTFGDVLGDILGVTGRPIASDLATITIYALLFVGIL